MEVANLSVEALVEAPWNPNQMDEGMMDRLKESLGRFGMLGVMVVRPLEAGRWEVLSGNQRLRVLKDIGAKVAPCIVVELDDAHACLLAQALNRIQGEDDLGLKAELVRQVLKEIPQNQVLDLLPESIESLEGLAALGQLSIEEYLQAWEASRNARLRHLQFHFTDNQLEVIEEALERVAAGSTKEDWSNPNQRSNALYWLCLWYLDRKAHYTSAYKDGP